MLIRLQISFHILGTIRQMIAQFVVLQPIVEQVFLVFLLSAVLLALLVTFAAPLVVSSPAAVVPF